MTILKPDGSEISASVVLKQYFGQKPGQNAAGFLQELRALSDEDKQELAFLAAKELGFMVSL